MKKNYSTSFIIGMLLALMLISRSQLKAQACSPLQIPTLMGSTVTATSLLLDWRGNTVYHCPDAIDVEIKCASASYFTGLGVYTFTSATVTGTSTPYYYPTQTINTSSFCPGSVYQFRARERNNPGVTSGGWSATMSFTTQGTYVTPTYSLYANPDTIATCANDTSYLSIYISNTCNSSAANYTWSPAAGLSCTNCVYPKATPTITTVYTVTAKGDQLSCWSVTSKTIQVTVNSCIGIKTLAINNKSVKLFPNPSNGNFKVQIDAEVSNAELIVLNTLGQIVHKQNVSQGINTVNINALPGGLYNYSVLSNKKEFARGKLIKQ